MLEITIIEAVLSAFNFIIIKMCIENKEILQIHLLRLTTFINSID